MFLTAVSDRDTFMEFTNACSILGTHLSRIAEDFILWNSTEFGFIRLPDAFTTGSSLMPQKKNPDSLELIRGKSGRLAANAMSLSVMCKGLPLTYNRDLQEDKPPVFDSFDTARLCLMALAGTVEGVTVNKQRCAEAVSDPMLLATDIVDYLVTKGEAFRSAHHIVGALVALSETKGTPLNKLPLDDVKRISPLFDQDWSSCFDLTTAMNKRDMVGMPSPDQVDYQLTRWQAWIDDKKAHA